MAQPPPLDPNPDLLGLSQDDVPQFPARPFYIPLPPYPVTLMELPLRAIARLYCDADRTMAFVTFHPRYGPQPAEFNQDVWLPVPPKEVFHLRHLRGHDEIMLSPLDGRSYGISLRRTFKICVGNIDMFCLEEADSDKKDKTKKRKSRKREHRKRHK